MSDFHIRQADWIADGMELRRIRETVFVHEQGVPLELEWDGLDDGCMHLLAEDAQGRAIGCGRMLPDGHIGRMAVLPEWRGRGVGRSLLDELIKLGCALGHPSLQLNAQCSALGFYARQGFVAWGDIFDDAGIPHRAMRYDCA